MNKKAIKIDLSVFFDDERKMSYILVDPNWKSVACLQKRIELLFDVKSVRFLSDGCFLPPQESIEIMKFCNDIKAFVPKELLRKRNKKNGEILSNIHKSQKNTENEDTTNTELSNQEEAGHQNKRKFYSLDGCFSEHNLSRKPKRSKNCHNSHLLESANKMDEISQFEIGTEKIHTTKSKNKKVSVSIVTPIHEAEDHSRLSKHQITNNFANYEEKNSASRNLDDQHKQHPTSTPKLKKKSKIEENTSNSEMKKPTSPSSTPSSTILNESKVPEECVNANDLAKIRNLSSNPFRKSKSNRAHIYFDESGEIASSTIKAPNLPQKKGKECKTIVKFRCLLSDNSNDKHPKIPRIFYLKRENVRTSKTTKQKVNIQEDIILPPIAIEISKNNKLSLTNDETATNDDDNPEKSNESLKKKDETSSLNDEGNSDNTIVTGDTAIANNDKEEEQTSAKHSEESYEKAETQNESQMNLTNVNANVFETQNNSQVELSEVNESGTHNESEIEVTQVDENISGVHNKSHFEQASVKEISTMSVDCVDLSVDLDEESKMEETFQEKQDLTADDESNKSSDVEEISEVIDLNESEDICNTLVNNPSTGKKSNKNTNKIRNILPFSTDLLDLPKAEDIIVFKVPYQDENKMFINTGFIAGKVEYVNRRTKCIKILIIDGVLELRHVPNKFVCNLDDSQEYIKYLQLKLTDMREAKVFNNVL